MRPAAATTYFDWYDEHKLAQTICAETRQWQASPDSSVYYAGSFDSPLVQAIERYLYCALKYENSAPSGRWILDGVSTIKAQEITPTRIRLAGVAYWFQSAPFFLAPFELEFRFAEALDEAPTRRIVRFGITDEASQIRQIHVDSSHYRLLQELPRRNRDWAFAVELP